MMNDIQAYTDVLRIRSKFKRLQQLSWTVSKMEQRFPVEEVDAKKYEHLRIAYKSMVDELTLIYDELKDEQLKPIER